jgi:hypothetical protein
MPWAAVFAAVANSLTTGVTVAAGVLLVLYPLIDAVASLIDARSQRGSARQLLALYAAAGGSDFVIQAWLLARRRRLMPLPA